MDAEDIAQKIYMIIPGRCGKDCSLDEERAKKNIAKKQILV